jgi:hypothetical protein
MVMAARLDALNVNKAMGSGRALSKFMMPSV